MGIYSTTGILSYDNPNVLANESYFGITGSLNALIDMEKNNNAIFESTISRDFQAAVMIHEGADEETMYAFNEASIGGFFSKVKAMVLKIWEKIKGIFSTFLKKLDGVIIRDNKKFVEKYQKEVRMKDLSKMKYKIQKRKKGFDELKNIMTKENDWIIQANTVFNMFRDGKAYKGLKSEIEDGDYYSTVINNVLGLKNVELNELPKEIHDHCFDTEESEEGVKADLLTDIIQVLKGDKTKTDIEKAQTAANKHFKKLTDNLDDIATQISKNIDTSPDTKTKNADIKGLSWKHTDLDVDGLSSDQQAKTTGNKGNGNLHISNAQGSTYMQRAGVLQNAISQIETVHSNSISCFLNENKFNITQSRKIFGKAVAYNDKKAKNEAMEIYLDAVEEAAEYEITSLFEDYSLYI